ncbi:hypothetical protein BGZ63DRAFT_418656 [Mariannaea sp. PMI_226]|nr:hypothetical protein BGZ63DRAFT_418656 [Mariannaea sp. PMI_226]
MDAATKSVQLLSQRVLPELPHNLAFHADWRHRPPAIESKKYFEEWNNPRLQYMTLVSEADRGVLLTRSYHDMRVEARPAHRDIKALTKTGGEKKKLSLSDYKKKTTGGTADTTPEPPSTKKREMDRPYDKVKSSTLPMGKADGQRPKDPHTTVNSKPPRPQENMVDMRLPPKPPSVPPRHVSPETRKRIVDTDDDPRSQKRPRPDSRLATDERSRPSRDEAPRRRDRDSLPAIDHRPERDGKLPTSSSLTNGRAVLKNATATGRNSSPVGRARGDSMNGVRPGQPLNTRNTPTKPDSSSRPSVPPLLSPLHINLDGRDGRDGSDRDRKKAREDAIDGTRTAKSKKLEEPPKPRRDKSPPPRLPALLSPTLPPLIESELAKRKPLKSEKNREERDVEEQDEPQWNEERYKEERASTSRKALPEQEDDQSSGKEQRPRSLIVTLRISKRMRQTLKRYLALPARKELPQHERHVSSETQPTQAKKRPVSSGEVIGDSISVKRPRTLSISSSSRLPPPPSTPSKRGTTAMSRVSSSNSQVHTPGDATTVTPSALGSSERPVLNGTDGMKADRTESRALQEEKHGRFSTLGRRLKHKGDVAMKQATQAVGDARKHEAAIKLGYVLTVESIIAFMTSFQALNMARSLGGKAGDPACWETLFPLLEFLQRDMRRLDTQRYVVLHTIVMLLHAVTVDEVIKCYTTFENPSAHLSMHDLVRHERARSRIWGQIRDANKNIPLEQHRADIAPWSSLDDIFSAVFRTLRHWCNDETIDWSPEINIKDFGPRSHHS